MADYNSDRTGSNIDLTLDKVDALDAKVQPTATGANVTGTLTADGLTIEGTSSGLVNLYRSSANANFGAITFKDTTNTNTNAKIGWNANELRLEGTSNIRQVTDNKNRMLISSGGDVSFYEDTGTTAKFVWDASAERLGVGTFPAEVFHVYHPTSNINALIESGDANAYLAFKDNTTTSSASVFLGASGNNMTFHAGGVSERMRIDSDGNVGIGSIPTAKLDVNGGTVYPKVKIQASSNTSRFMQLGMDNATEYSIEANGAGTNLLFKTVGTERARIDSSGNLLVGKTSLNSSTQGIELREGGRLGATYTQGNPAYFNRLGSDGEIVRLLKDGSTVGSIGANGGRPYFSRVEGGFSLSSNGHFIPATANGDVSDNARDIGISVARWKDLYLSGGVYLGGTGAANKLDDYEEGTFTPSFIGSTTAGSYSSSVALGWYTKIGRQVTVSGYFYGLSGTGVGNLHLTGLPFSININENSASGCIQANDSLLFPSGTITTPWFVVSSSALGVRCTKSNASYEWLAYPAKADYIRFQLTYNTTA